MAKRKMNFKTTLFVVAALLAVMFLWLGISLAPVYWSYAFQDQKSEPETEETAFSRPDKKTSGVEDPVKDPFITKNPNIEPKISQPQIDNSDPVFGSSEAPVTIVQFSDFKCEYCHQQEKILQQLKEEYKDKIRVVWKDYPDSDHQSPSWQAAKAARCAQEQDKFWSYQDKLYQTEENLNQKTFLRLASQEDLDVTAFKKCLQSPQVNNLIEKDIQEANSLGITGIPFLYINDRGIMGKVNKDSLKKMIKMELQK